MPDKICQTCLQSYNTRGAKYCSVECYNAAPRIKSAETCKNIAVALRGKPKPWLRGKNNPNWGNKARGGKRTYNKLPTTKAAKNITRVAHIYTITNQHNGSVYVGWTVNTNRRWSRHLNRATSGYTGWLYSAMRKYGSDSFVFSVVETWQSENEALEAERWLIGYLRYLGAHLYNMTDGGEGTTGRTHSLEAKRKMSEAAKKRPPPSEETRLKISACAKLQVHTDERRRKTSERQTGQPSPLRGKSISPAHKEKQKVAALKRWERERSQLTLNKPLLEGTPRLPNGRFQPKD
jgi:group I intron endonuclease